MTGNNDGQTREERPKEKRPGPQDFHVSWDIDIYAESAEEAIAEALVMLSDQIHRNNDAYPPVLTARDSAGNETSQTVEP
jgi:hypothetical protein